MAKKSTSAPWALSPHVPGVVRYVPIEKVEAHGSTKVIVLSSELYALYTHWHKGRTVPCLNKGQGPLSCPYHDAPIRWKAYLCCWLIAAKKKAFIELTTVACNKLLSEVGEQSLRGSIVLLERERPTKKAPISVTYLGRVEDGFKLPEEVSPEPTLRRLWNLDS